MSLTPAAELSFQPPDSGTPGNGPLSCKVAELVPGGHAVFLHHIKHFVAVVVPPCYFIWNGLRCGAYGTFCYGIL